MRNFAIHVEGIEKALVTVDAEKLKQATISALNRISDRAFTEANRLIRQKYNIKLRDLRSNAFVKHASKWYPVATIQSKGRPGVPMITFMRGSADSRPVQVEITKGKKVKLTHAFVATMKSGYTGIFERKNYSTLKSRRQVIGQLYGPSIPVLYGSRQTEKVIRNTFRDEFERRHWHEYTRLVR